ncbi:MAG TPA: hypothetical protein VEY30_03875, partial [Myxococcaceae bacterium]|nr:hypothetical protein [Myxococcaceae bacterium]
RCAMMLSTWLPLAAVGSGRIVGGWNYVWVSYGITWGAIALYALSLWRRSASSSHLKEPQ